MTARPNPKTSRRAGLVCAAAALAVVAAACGAEMYEVPVETPIPA